MMKTAATRIQTRDDFEDNTDEHEADVTNLVLADEGDYAAVDTV